MSEIEPHQRPGKEVAPRHIPQEIVPVPLDDVRNLVRDAVRGTSLVDPFAHVLAGWAFFEPHLRFTAVDATHTRIEIDVVGIVRGAETLLFNQRRAEIDRFFVAIQDELDRRERRQPHPSAGGTPIEAPPGTNRAELEKHPPVDPSKVASVEQIIERSRP